MAEDQRKSKHYGKELKVAVVGGSIAGVTAAIELSRVGCQVSVYERSGKKLSERGTGIGIPVTMIDYLQKRDLLDSHIPTVSAMKRLFVYRSHTHEKSNEEYGRVLWEGQKSGAVLRSKWGLLYDNLRRRLPDECYHQGCDVTRVKQTGANAVSLQLNDSQELLFDFVIFADGHHSFGRRTLFPNHETQYAGYVAWRGLIKEKNLANNYLFEDRITYAVCDKGICLLYIIPGANNEIEAGRRCLNWVFYEKVLEKNLPEILTDKKGIVHHTSIPQGLVSTSHKEYLHSLVREKLPKYVADIICATKKPFIQKIFDLQLPSYRCGPICLIGDAAAVVRPHTGRGAMKAITNATSLADALTSHTSIDDALQNWDKEQRELDNKLLALGKNMGRVMVEQAPDWKTMDKEAMEQWWASRKARR